MPTFKRVNRKFIVTHEGVEYTLPEHHLAWVLIFKIKEEMEK
jgi:hypothetical protein